MKMLITNDFNVKINKKNNPVVKKILILLDFLCVNIFFSSSSQKKVSYNSNALGMPKIIILGSGIILLKYST
jgi:hypothetical protein